MKTIINNDMYILESCRGQRNKRGTAHSVDMAFLKECG